MIIGNSCQLDKSKNFMKINAALVMEHRLKRSLSQDELAIMAGLSIRTIQRIEKEGTASLQTKKALAAALEIDVHDLSKGGPNNRR